MCESISCCLQGSAKRCDKSPAVRSPVSESFYSRYISLKRTNKISTNRKFSFLYSVGRARQREQECGLAKGWREDFPGFPVDFKRSRVESGQEEALALARCGGKILAASRNPSGHPAPPAAAPASASAASVSADA